VRDPSQDLIAGWYRVERILRQELGEAFGGSLTDFGVRPTVLSFEEGARRYRERKRRRF
jgi:hypothetical protein